MKTSGKKQAGRFKRGQSGNPKGRPKGLRNQATVLLENMLAEDGEAIVKAVVKAAKDGDMVAARMVLDRVFPLRKGRTVTLDLPTVQAPGDLVIATGAIVGAVAAGEITPDEGSALTGMLDGQRRAIELTDIEKRLGVLERREGLKS